MLLVVKAGKYIGTQPKCTKPWKQSSDIQQLLEALLLAMKMCTGLTTDVIWMCSVTSETSQSSNRRVFLPLRTNQCY